MAPRRTSLALVLVLLAGVFALSEPPPPSQAEPCEQTDALNGSQPLSKLRRSVKRFDTPRRREPSQQHLHALPACGFALATAEAIQIVGTIVAITRHDRETRRLAHARAPPASAS